MFWTAGSRRKLLIAGIPLLAVLLIIAATLRYKWARSSLEGQAHDALNQEWVAMKGYLRIEQNPQNRKIEGAWYYDSNDQDEAAAVSRIREACLIADENGQVLHESRTFQDVGIDSPSQIRNRIRGALSSPEAGRTLWMAKQSAEGSPYLIRAGIVFDEHRRSPYYVALAVPPETYMLCSCSSASWPGVGICGL